MTIIFLLLNSAVAHYVLHCSFVNPGELLIHHDAYHKRLLFELKIPDQVHVILRAQVDQQNLPACPDLAKAIADHAPDALDWNLEAASGQVRISDAVDECPRFPLVLDQTRSSITVDCFYLNNGDSRITWSAPRNQPRGCIKAVNRGELGNVCSSLRQFTDKLTTAKDLIHRIAMEKHNDDLRLALAARRELIEDSSDSESDDEFDFD